MIFNGKSFVRRPWEATEAGFIRHVDGVAVTNITGGKAMAFALHSATDFLVENGKDCKDPAGWYWPALVVENFSIAGLIKSDGIMITEGNQIPEIKHDITIRNGTIARTDKDSTPFCLQFINFNRIAIESITMIDVSHPVLSLRNCDGEVLALTDCNGLIIKNDGASIKRIEMQRCTGIDLGDFKGMDTQILNFGDPKKAVGTEIKGSMAIIVVVNGEAYKAEAANLRFTSTGVIP